MIDLYLDLEFFVEEEAAAAFASCRNSTVSKIKNPSDFDLPSDTEFRFFVQYVIA